MRSIPRLRLSSSHCRPVSEGSTRTATHGPSKSYPLRTSISPFCPPFHHTETAQRFPRPRLCNPIAILVPSPHPPLSRALYKPCTKILHPNKCWSAGAHTHSHLYYGTRCTTHARYILQYASRLSYFRPKSILHAPRPPPSTPRLPSRPSPLADVGQRAI
ncbi:hypothetical protein BDN70DRAFT_364519 [Pholiota conissans]|uniref:Uncharacterized protein n=1 Tax=Pholiota conissans TaxID=109636 RepID=A0A9P6CVI3_9AGAR|nr:hypothetical protein BDN70DRAFT_364519 [Pholiota conissans]